MNEGFTTSPVSDTHTYMATGTYTVRDTVTDDDTGTVTVSDTIEVVDAAVAVADAIEDLADFVNDPTQDPAAVVLVQDALGELNGKNGGHYSAPDMLDARDGQLERCGNEGLMKLSKAIPLLEEADLSTDVDLGITVSQLVLAAKAAVVDLVGKAQAKATKSAHWKMIATAEARFAEGEQLFAAGDAMAAVEAYSDSIRVLFIADLDGDGAVDHDDVRKFHDQLFTSGPDADFNCDGIVNGNDWEILYEQIINPALR